MYPCLFCILVLRPLLYSFFSPIRRVCSIFTTRCLRSTVVFFFFSSRRRHTRYWRDWSSDVCSSDLCALTGAGDTVGRSEHVPVTPEQIAESGIAAARAGATIVHVHVRDPQTGKGSRDVALYKEAVERIRDSGVDVIINTTAGMGGDLVLDPQEPTRFVDGTDLVNGVERLAHVGEVMPDICTLDCGSLNFGEGSTVYVSTPDILRDGAKRIQELGVRVEMEIFDTGHLWFATQLVEEDR